jgi:proteic killer suppression protein
MRQEILELELDIAFASEQLRKLCNNSAAVRKKYGQGNAKKLLTRLEDLASATCLEDVRHLAGHCHELTGDRAGQLAMSLEGGWRLIFTPAHDPLPRRRDGSLDWTRVSAIEVLEIVNYHKG